MGGKSGKVRPEKAPNFVSDAFNIGGATEGASSTFKEDESKDWLNKVKKNKLGTRGLQIPLEAEKSTTKSDSSFGIQL